MHTRLSACVTTNGSVSSVIGTSTPTVAGFSAFFAGGFSVLSGLACFSDEGSGVAGGGGINVGRKVSSFGANLAASSLVGNSMATKTTGTSVRTAQLANINRDWASASEFFFKKLMSDLNCGPGSA